MLAENMSFTIILGDAKKYYLRQKNIMNVDSRMAFLFQNTLFFMTT